MNALALEVPVEEDSPLPLHWSSRLQRISESASASAKVYGRHPLRLSVDGGGWRFAWVCLTAPLTGAELRVRFGDTEAIVSLENLSALGAAAEVRSGVPSELQVAYLNGLGTALWREVENLTQRAVEVLEVRLDQPLIPDPESLGFEIARSPQGPATLGLLRFVDADPLRNAELRRVLTAVSLREMAEPALLAGLPLPWSAELARTSLSEAELRSLEVHDVIVLDESKPTAAGWTCRLNLGDKRHYAGRVELRKGGRLQMIQFGRNGDPDMNSETEVAAGFEAGFEDVSVNLRFEVAQFSATLAEMSRFAPGSVIDLGQRVDEQAVSIWVGQRCIAKGQLVALGERLGVRLLSVQTREHD